MQIKKESQVLKQILFFHSLHIDLIYAFKKIQNIHWTLINKYSDQIIRSKYTFFFSFHGLEFNQS